ncbi:MAG: glycosyltransferase [Bacteroidota bacterium]
MTLHEIAVAALLVLHGGLFAVLLTNLVYLRRTRVTADDWPRTEGWPTVSVLIPARNEESNLQRLLPSLAAQTYPHLEVVVVDDASEDGTWRVLQEALTAFEDAGHALRLVQGNGPPADWLGKPHALYQASRVASGSCYVFLDADSRLRHPDAVRDLVARFRSRSDGAAPVVMSGLPRYDDTGAAALLTGLVPFSILSALPLPLVPRTRSASIGALNGQCWMIEANAYHEHEPHQVHRDEILEDVQIGRTLKRRGLRLHFVDLSDVLAVRMYERFSDAWRGFRKNAYLLAGGRVATFVPLWVGYALTFVVAPWLSLSLLATIFALKGGCDLSQRLPLWLPLFAPASLLLASLLQFDSAVSHWTGRVAWKGRSL